MQLQDMETIIKLQNTGQTVNVEEENLIQRQHFFSFHMLLSSPDLLPLLMK